MSMWDQNEKTIVFVMTTQENCAIINDIVNEAAWTTAGLYHQGVRSAVVLPVQPAIAEKKSMQYVTRKTRYIPGKICRNAVIKFISQQIVSCMAPNVTDHVLLTM